MTAGFLVSFLTQTTMMALSIVKMYRMWFTFSLATSNSQTDSYMSVAGVSWNVVTGMCVTARTTPRFIGVWASPVSHLSPLLILVFGLISVLAIV